MGELLEDVEGALIQRDLIEKYRVREAPDLVRIVVSIDPATTSHEGSDETGLCVTGIGSDGHFYVLHSEGLRVTPQRWAYRAWQLYDDWAADTMIYESNQGGDMVKATLLTVRDGMHPKGVHASRGKHTRAEPIASLFEQGKVHMVGSFPALEDQWTQWVPGDPSPDQLDACVWGLTELMQRGIRPRVRVGSVKRR